MYLSFLEFLGKALYFMFCFASADGRPTVDISVNGDQVVKTGIATYTIYNTLIKEDRILTISCLSFLSIPSTISLSKNGSLLDSFNTNKTAFKEFSLESWDVNSLEGTYSCRFNFSSQTYNKDQHEYFIERGVQIYTSENKEICASSVGLSGYFGEKVTFICEDFSYRLTINFFQAGQLLNSKHSLRVNILESNTTFQCIDSLYKDLKCKLEMEVYESLEIAISPILFTLDSQVNSFSCNSTPPRMLYWEFIGNDGNVMDINNAGHFLQAGGNITIKQEAGFSFLNIPPTTKGTADLGIHKIACYAYDARTRSVAFATLESSTKTSECNPALCTNPPQTSFQTFEDDNRISTMTTISTSFQGENTGEEKTINSKQHSTSFGPTAHVPKKESGGKIKDWKLLCTSVIASCEAILLFIIAGLWICGKCGRGDKNPSSKSVCTVNIVSSETDLHDNPVYQPYGS